MVDEVGVDTDGWVSVPNGLTAPADEKVHPVGKLLKVRKSE